MKMLNKKGFTLIELLAVITIMGILMIVAIPAISRTIENSRKDTFIDTAKQYVNAAKTMWAGDTISCQTTSGNDLTLTVASALPADTYYLYIDSSNNELLQSGGKSSWASLDTKGWIKLTVTGSTTTASSKVAYEIKLTDNVHGIKEFTSVDGNVPRSKVETTGATFPTLAGILNPKYCVVTA